jgi:PRTRC genetic system protein E
MFNELAPLLRHRSVLFTVSHLGDDQFRVNVVPKKIDDSDNVALTIPVSVSGTAEDLDAQLAGTLVNFVSSHLELRNTLERAKADMAAAAKSAQAEARGKSKSQVEKKGTNSATTTRPPSVEASVEQKPEPAKTPNLFDAAVIPEPVRVSAVAASVVERTRHELSDEDREILAEVNAQRQEGEEGTDEDPDDTAESDEYRSSSAWLKSF